MAEESADKRVWRNALGLVGGNAVGEVLSLVVHAQIMQILGPAGYGRLSQATAVMDLSDGVAGFGLNQLGPVLGVDYEGRLGRYLGTILAFRAAFTALVLAVVFVLAPLLESTEAWLVRFAALGICFSPLAGTATVPFFLRQENWRVAWLPGASALVNITLLLLVIYFVPRVEWVIAAILATRAFNALMISELARRRYGFRYGFDREVLGKVLSIGPRAAWLDGVVILYSKASYFVLDGLGQVTLGIYAVADKVTSPFLRVTGALSAASLAQFAQYARERDWSGLKGFYVRNLRRLAVALSGIAVVVFAIVPPIIRHFFEAYTDAIDVLYVLYAGLCFMAVNQMTTSVLNGLGRFGWVAVVATINLGVYLVGAWLWVDDYGALGAALATTTMEGCNMCMQVILMMRALRRSAEFARETHP